MSMIVHIPQATRRRPLFLYGWSAILFCFCTSLTLLSGSKGGRERSRLRNLKQQQQKSNKDAVNKARMYGHLERRSPPAAGMVVSAASQREFRSTYQSAESLVNGPAPKRPAAKAANTTRRSKANFNPRDSETFRLRYEQSRFVDEPRTRKIKSLSSGATSDMDHQQTGETCWCILDSRNIPDVYFSSNIAHAAQAFYPCFSFFERQREIQGRGKSKLHMSEGSTLQFGLLFQSPKAGLDSIPWKRDFVIRLNWTIYYADEHTPVQTSTLDCWYRPVGFSSPMPKAGVGRFEWFEKSQDATALTQRLLAGSALTVGHDSAVAVAASNPPSTIKTHQDSSDNGEDVIRIGIVDRAQTRRLVNAGSILRALKQEFSQDTTAATKIVLDQQVVRMESLTFLEQVQWWNQHDIVILAHGSAEANLPFLSRRGRHRPAVIEIYPDYYFPTLFFPSLAQSAGVSSYMWLNHTVVADPKVRSSSSLASDLFWSEYARQKTREIAGQDLHPPPSEIVPLVRQAIGNSRSEDATKVQAR